jgi:hypothetical protein
MVGRAKRAMGNGLKLSLSGIRRHSLKLDWLTFDSFDYLSNGVTWRKGSPIDSRRDRSRLERSGNSFQSPGCASGSHLAGWSEPF